MSPRIVQAWIGAVALSAIVSSQAVAQDGSLARPEASEKALAPAGSTSTGLGGSGVVVTAETGKTAVSLTLAQTFDSESRFDTWTLKGATPLDEEAGEGVFVTDDDLAHGASLELGWTGVFTTSREAPPATTARRRAFLSSRHASCISALGLSPKDADVEACRAKTFSDYEKDLTERERAEFLDPFTSAPLILAGISAAIGYDEVKFRSPTNPADEESERRVPWSVTGKIGVLPDAHRLYIGGGLSYERSFEEASKRTLCTPASGTDPQECYTGPFEAPAETDSTTLFAVARTRWEMSLPRGRSLPLGLEVKPAYDVEREVAGVSASLYFLPEKTGGLTGGLRLRVQTDDDDPLTHDENVSVGLFVGKAFSLF